ncbi:MAG: zinc-dependent alcohol dehydrogenase family protein [Acidobacteria bacterium]|nr:zinc-dependent alcohol dehydrogenase family protein [Acidobacteriota bacterium]
MRAWSVPTPGPLDAVPLGAGPLVLGERDVPTPASHQLRLRVVACGVCRTDLHVVTGDLPVHRPNVVPGHEIVGVVDEAGPGATRFHRGDRVGAAWLARTCGTCRFCLSHRENLCLAPTFTGWDVDGGYATFVVVNEEYVYSLPQGFDDVTAAPLLCAGIIGYRALRRTELPPGGRLGIYGFGGSAHLTAQIAIAQGARVHVMTRSPESRELALSLGAASVGDTNDAPPELLDGAILFAPVGDIVPVALASLDRGGVLAVAGIYLSDIPDLNYERHLFQEKTLRSVTANTRDDGEEFLDLALKIGIATTVHRYPFDHAAQALSDLANDRFTGAAVLTGFDV